MPANVVLSATTTCTMGSGPSMLNVLPTPILIEGRPAATITDSAPMANIVPFGTCKSQLNPLTAAATVAAAGNLTPAACVPATGMPWVPGAPTTLVGGIPALTAGSTCVCLYGGVISIINAGAVRTQTG
jgi:uncharacterized Zn-binding protein involved in type VI secretion